MTKHCPSTGFFRTAFVFILSLFPFWGAAWADETLKPYINNVHDAEKGMTFWQLLEAGGLVMILIGILSVVMLSLVIYLFLRLRANEFVPVDFAHKVIREIRSGDDDKVLEICRTQENAIATIVLSGLDKRKEGPKAVREAVEIAARQETSLLWTLLNYLSDIVAVAPMLGLLGTVVGMIQAFNTIAFQSAVVKPILLAAGVSKAMVTTAGGLSVAIIATVFYSLLRLKTQTVTNLIETFSAEILEAFGEETTRGPGPRKPSC